MARARLYVETLHALICPLLSFKRKSELILEMDFKRDWHEILRRVMSDEWGMDVSGITSNVPMHYFNALQRRVMPTPRKLHISDTFCCPSGFDPNWQAIQRLIATGGDLHPFLSKQVDKAEYTDAMLNDWGIHHLHFRARPQRSGPLIFARITSGDVYAVSVLEHGEWYEDEIVETIHRNWPDSIRQWRMNGQPAVRLTQDERKTLRKKHCNAFYTTLDGVTYGPIGGGMMTSGYNLFAVMEMDKEHDRLEKVEQLLANELPQFRAVLKKAGCTEGDIVSATLNLSDSHYGAYFPVQKLLVNITPRVG